MRNCISKSVAGIAVLGLALPIYVVAGLHAIPPSFPQVCKKPDGNLIGVVYNSTGRVGNKDIRSKCAVVGGTCEDVQDCFNIMAANLDLCPRLYEDQYLFLYVPGYTDLQCIDGFCRIVGCQLRTTNSCSCLQGCGKGSTCSEGQCKNSK